MGLKKFIAFVIITNLRCRRNSSKIPDRKKSDDRGIPFGKAAVFEILKMFIYLLTMCEPLYVH